MEKKCKWKKHFDKSRLVLSHPDPARFVRGPWHPGTGPPVPTAFLAYRLTISILFLCGLGWSLAVNWEAGKWLIFLTSWGFLTCAVQSVMGTALVVIAYRRQRVSGTIRDSIFDMLAEEKRMPISYKVYWVLYNVAIPVALFITILYWSLLYKPDAPSRGPFFLNFVVHAGNSILCLVELAVGGLPSRFPHALHPFLFTTVYVFFNVIYWAAGGLGSYGSPYIYSVLDWDKNPELGAGIVVGSAVLLVAIHAVICALAGLRTLVARKMRKRGENNIAISTLPQLETGNFNKGFTM